MHNIVTASVQEKTARAEQSLLEGRLSPAISGYSRAIFLEPRNPALYERLASIYESVRDLSTSLNLYKKAYSLENKDSTRLKIKALLLRKGLALLEINSVRNILLGLSYEEFARGYEDWALETLAATASSHLRNAFAFIETGNKQFALEELGKAIADGDLDSLALRGKINWALGRHSEGNADFWTLKAKAPDSAEVGAFMRLISPQMDSLLKQTRYFLLENNQDKCLINIKRGLAVYPGNPDLLVMRAYINRRRGLFPASLEDLALAHLTAPGPQISSQLAITHNEMGMSAFAARDYEEAVRMFVKALRHKPDEWGFLVNQGDCYRQLEEPDKALACFEQAETLAGSRPEIKERKAIVYCSKGVKFFNKRLLEESRELFQKAVENVPRKAVYRTLLARTLLELGEARAAAAQLRKSLELDPDNYETKQLYNSVSGDQAI